MNDKLRLPDDLNEAETTLKLAIIGNNDELQWSLETMIAVLGRRQKFKEHRELLQNDEAREMLKQVVDLAKDWI